MKLKLVIVPAALVLLLLALGNCTGNKDSLRFSHKFHVSEEEMDCSDCHRKVDSNEDLALKDMMPSETTCLSCHKKQKENCGFCHTQPEAPQKAPRFRLEGVTFSHQRHVPLFEQEEEKDTCAKCHAQTISEESPPLSEPAERVQECMSCHQKDADRLSCDGCHSGFKASDDYPMDFAAHRGNFLQRHGAIARGNMVVCNHCHSEAGCAECHSNAAPMRPRLLSIGDITRATPHAADFMTTHPVEARADGDRCLTCHQPERCQGCHERREVAASREPGLGPHPAQWMAPGPFGHGAAARRDILSCAVCHDRGQETNCISCHRVGGAGGSPHADGWTSTQDVREGRTCIWCH